MALDKLNTVKSFLDRVLEKVPEADRAALRADYSKAHDEVDGLQTSLEEATARVNQTATKQREWWEGNKDAVAERDTLKKQLEGGGRTGGVDEGELQKRLDAQREEIMGTGLAVSSMQANLVGQHFAEFGKSIDIYALTQEALKAGKPLLDVYNEKMAPERATRATAAHDKEIAEATEAGRKAGLSEGLKRVGDGMPYPVGQAPTTLAGLKKPEAGAANPFSLEAAVATAEKVAAGTH